VESTLGRMRLDPTSELSFTGQIRAQLTLLIADGKLAPGSRLPSVRALAKQLGVNVNTIRSAYAKLQADGVVATHHGVGTTVLSDESGSLSPGVPKYLTNSVGVLIAGLDPFYIDLLRGIEAKGDEQGTLLFIVDIEDSEVRARAAIRQLSARGAEGVIAISMGGLGEDASSGAGPPIVYVDQPDRTGTVLLFNADKAGFEATEHLAQHGHERIGFVTCPLDWPNQGELFAGYKRAHDERGWPTAPNLLATVGAFDVASGRRGLRMLLDQPDPPSAVIASGGMLALGVLQEASQRGIDVPTDLAIVGYADAEVAQFTSPALTMVSLPTYDVGVAAMSALQRIIAGDSSGPERTVFDGVLVVRQSCGPHPFAVWA